MLTAIQLEFQQTEFQIFQILERHDSDYRGKLLEVSAEIVALLLQLGLYRRKAVYLHLRFSYVVRNSSSLE